MHQTASSKESLPVTRVSPRHRAQFPVFRSIDLRWNDIDIYGHVNNAIFFELFDTAVNGWLAEQNLFQKPNEPICLVARHACDYFSEVKWQDQCEIGLALDKIGRSSLVYAPALFIKGRDHAAAQGEFVHVAVDRIKRHPVPIDEAAKAKLQTLMWLTNEP